MEPCRPKLGKRLHLHLDKMNHSLIWRASNTDRHEVRQTSNHPIRVWGPIRKWAPMQCGPDATKPVHSNVSISVPSWRIEIANPEIRHMASTISSRYLYYWYFLRFNLTYYAPSFVLCWLKLDQHSTWVVPVACSSKFRSAGVTLWRTLATWNGDDAWKQNARVKLCEEKQTKLATIIPTAPPSSRWLRALCDVAELDSLRPVCKDTSDYTVTWLKVKTLGHHFQLGIPYWATLVRIRP